MFAGQSVSASVTGRVTDEAGVPVAGAVVVLAGETSPGMEFEAITDDEGRYAMTASTGVDRQLPDTRPAPFRLHQNFPNPFNPGTTIPFTTTVSSHAELTVYDILGRPVRVVFDRMVDAGAHVARWNGTDRDGRSTAAGVYLYRLVFEGRAETGRMLRIDGGFGGMVSGGGVHPGPARSPAARPAVSERTFQVTVISDEAYHYQKKSVAVVEGQPLDITVRRVSERTRFLPGAVFRDHVWRGPFVNAGAWQRVTGPEATHSGAKEFLPNPVNRIVIDDLEGAVAVEAVIELLQCHAGTRGKRIRLNEGPWIDIPEAPGLPVPSPECWQTMRYPAIEVPLSDVMEGTNTFELTAGNQSCNNFGWPQYIIYGVTFRVFYDAAKPHPSGNIVSPLPGAVIGEDPVIEVRADDPESVAQVDVIGMYDDFNYEGGNRFRRWRYTSRYGRIQNHAGSATEPPFRVTWDTEWVPDQRLPVAFMARITGREGMSCLTEAAGNVSFVRDGHSVRMYPPHDVPAKWVSRAGRAVYCNALILDDLSRAADARMTLSTWAGTYCEKIAVNGGKVAGRVGRSYDLVYVDVAVPTDILSFGRNSIYTFSTTQGHGIEVNWPGPVLKVRYETGR